MEKLDSKSIATIITSVGGIVLAAFAIWGLIQSNKTTIERVEGAINNFAQEQFDIRKEELEVKKDFNELLIKNVEVLTDLKNKIK